MNENGVLANKSRLRAWLDPKLVLMDVEAVDRDHALDTIAGEVARVCSLQADMVRRALWRREQAGSTSVGGGFAIPHGQVAGIQEPITVYMRTRQPIPFGARTGEPVQELLVILVPADGHRDDHLQLLALVAMLFGDPRFRERLREVKGTDDVRAVFRAGFDGLQGS